MSMKKKSFCLLALSVKMKHVDNCIINKRSYVFPFCMLHFSFGIKIDHGCRLCQCCITGFLFYFHTFALGVCLRYVCLHIFFLRATSHFCSLSPPPPLTFSDSHSTWRTSYYWYFYGVERKVWSRVGTRTSQVSSLGRFWFFGIWVHFPASGIFIMRGIEQNDFIHVFPR